MKRTQFQQRRPIATQVLALTLALGPLAALAEIQKEIRGLLQQVINRLGAA